MMTINFLIRTKQLYISISHPSLQKIVAPVHISISHPSPQKIIGAAASQFSLLPTTDNSSGNYTKVSQRIPVYIYTNSPPDGSLLPGMSVEVTIHLH